MYQRILVATDGSQLSGRAVKSAVDLALLCKATLFIFSVAQHQSASYFEDALAHDLDEMEAERGRQKQRAQQLVDTARQTALSQGLSTVESVVSEAYLVGEAIVSAAQDHGCELIVMASHGRRGFARLLMGSETLHVLTHSQTPVLVLR